jgi:LysR family glycine cleavage system transcriptional activator
MPESIPPLLGLHAYEAAARHGSFVGAAAELHLSPAAVSQRVRTLEAHLGVLLFERLPRSVQLTEMGRAYLPAVRDVFDDLSAATSGLFGGPGRGRLTVRAQVSYAVTWLAPRLPDFSRSHPWIDVRLVSTVWADTLPADQVDLDIRQGNGTWPGYLSMKLHDDVAVVLCGAGFLERHGPFAEISDLLDWPRVQVLGFDDLWERVGRSSDRPAAGSEHGLITVDTSMTAMSIVAECESWTIVPERFARTAVRNGTLAIAIPEAVGMRQDHYLLRPDTPQPPSGQAAAFTSWLQAQDLLDPPLVALADVSDGPAAG